MSKKYKILTTFVKDLSSEIPNVESFLYLKDNIPNYSLGIDINSKPLKNNMAEVDMKLTFEDKNKKENKTLFELTYAIVTKVEQEAVNKEELQKIFLRDVPNEIYPEIEKIFLNVLHGSGYPELNFQKKVDFDELYKKNQN